MGASRYQDLTEFKFTRLIPIEPCGKTSSGGMIWLCKCDCGNYVKAPANGLKCGDYKSYGCLQKEKAAKLGRLNKKHNKYIEHENYYEGKFLKSNKSFFFSKEDYSVVSNYCWHLTVDGYVATNIKDGVIKLHRLLMNFPDGIIDHKNRNKLDNTRDNLRIVTDQENAINSSISKRNTSGIIGVFFSKEKHKWAAALKVNGENKNLGRYKNKEDAIVARLKGELKYFGKEFAPQRHLFEQYGITEDSE